MKEFSATIKLHNNLLRERRQRLGLSTHELAAKIGIGYGSYLELENLRAQPFGRRPGCEGVSRTRVMQMENRALGKLRHASRLAAFQEIAEDFCPTTPESKTPDT